MAKALIIGGSGGIGSAIAKQLSADGWQLHLTGRNPQRLGSVAQALGAESTVGDVTDTNFWSTLDHNLGETLDAMIYAVGTINLKPLGKLTAADFDHDFAINAKGAALAVQTTLARLRRSDRGSILLFSSVAATQGFAMHGSMGMAKAAINGLTLSLAAELAPRIRINAIAPSLTQTPLAETVLASAPIKEAISKLHPLQRLGTADDIAALAAFLISPDSAWMTGQIIGVDGGRSTLAGK